MGAFLTAILGDDFALQMDSEHQPPDPFAKFLARVERERLEKSFPGISNARWDESLPAPVTKREEAPFANPLNFSKGSMGYKLRIDRVEEQVSADGEKWKYAYSGSDLVDVRLIQE